MDAIDHEIVSRLLRDGRATYAAIAREVGLSLPATKRRVDRLLETGAIRGFTALVDPQAMGWTLQAVVQLYTIGTVTFARLRHDLESVPEVTEALTITGAADTILRVVARDAEHLERVIARLRALDYVRQTDTTMVLSTLLRRTAEDLSAIS